MNNLIILYDKDEQDFNTVGIGILKDAASCIVTEELNGAYELEMEYPITGSHFADIKEDRIILCKANDDTSYQTQPFRISKITRPIDGTVTVYASHISYDAAGVPVRKVDAQSLEELVSQIQNRMMTNTKFTFTSTKPKSITDISFSTKIPYSLKALLAGNDESVLNTYDGEFIFDRYNITLTERRGSDKDFTIRYSKNMTDLERETSTDLMWDAIYPYYSNTTTETSTGINTRYKAIYISSDGADIEPLQDPVTGEDIYPPKWLTYTEKAKGLDVIVTTLVTNIIATEGDFENHLVHAKKCTPVGEEESGTYFYDVTYTMAYIRSSYQNEFGKYWLCTDESDPDRTIINAENYKWNPNDLPTTDPGDGSEWWNPLLHKDCIFRIYTVGEKLYKVYIYKKNDEGNYAYQEPSDDDNIKVYASILPSTYSTTTEKDNIILYEGNFVYVDEIRAQPKESEVEFSSTWLEEINELEQSTTSDSRWEVVGDITPEEGKIYKVPTIEVPIRAYTIHSAEMYSSGWLTLVEGSTTPLNLDGTEFVPEDAVAYIVNNDYEEYDTYGKDFIFRWSEYDDKYIQATDNRYTYKNYEWNGTQYVEHNSVNDRILMTDLTDQFDDEDSVTNTAIFQKKLYDESVEYITENKIGTIDDSIKVSFIKLSSSPEYSKWKELEHVCLGDTVHILYEELGVNEIKKVITTEYNVLTGTYDSIELGERSNNFTNNAIVTGDNVSALTNDVNYADKTTVNNLIAKSVTADYIKSVNAELTEAQINSLTSDDVTAAVLTSGQAIIDNIVSTLITADDAKIKHTLEVGDGVKVSGDIAIKSGSITIKDDEEGTKFIVDEEGNLTANSVDVTGKITATEGTIGDCEITIDPETGESKLDIPTISANKIQGGTISASDIKLGLITDDNGDPILDENNDEQYNFTVNGSTGDVSIKSGSIKIGNNFSVDEEGSVEANDIVVKGKISNSYGEQIQIENAVCSNMVTNYFAVYRETTDDEDPVVITKPIKLNDDAYIYGYDIYNDDVMYTPGSGYFQNYELSLVYNDKTATTKLVLSVNFQETDIIEGYKRYEPIKIYFTGMQARISISSSDSSSSYISDEYITNKTEFILSPDVTEADFVIKTYQGNATFETDPTFSVSPSAHVHISFVTQAIAKSCIALNSDYVMCNSIGRDNRSVDNIYVNELTVGSPIFREDAIINLYGNISQIGLQHYLPTINFINNNDSETFATIAANSNASIDITNVNSITSSKKTISSGETTNYKLPIVFGCTMSLASGKNYFPYRKINSTTTTAFDIAFESIIAATATCMTATHSVRVEWDVYADGYITIYNSGDAATFSIIIVGY